MFQKVQEQGEQKNQFYVFTEGGVIMWDKWVNNIFRIRELIQDYHVGIDIVASNYICSL